jgi:predicted RNase H-like nuclease/predicted house-cleaning noncanonical NTP pyrophosphatase (MazG superfamily)
MRYIGIDLAWTYTNESGICVIDDKGKIVYCESKVFSDEMISAIVEEHAREGAIVGIDAPLIVNNETGSRYCDRAIMKEKIHGKNLSVFTCSKRFMLNHFGVVRGEKVVKAIRNRMPSFSLTGDIIDKKHVIIETFPTGITLGLFPDAFPIKYKVKHKVDFETSKTEMGRMINLLKRLSDFNPPVHNIEDFFNHSSSIQALSKKEFKNLEDKLDAFLCSYAAYWLANHQGKVFGDEQDGFITIPIIDENRVHDGKSGSVKVYNKLIRDKIPQIIEQSGKKAMIEKVSGAEYLDLLNAKLGEELQEYLDSQSVEELADLVEVVYAILDYKGVSRQQFEGIRKQKVEERGAFRDKLLLKEVIDG